MFSELLLGPVLTGLLTLILGLAVWIGLWLFRRKVDWLYALVIGAVCLVTYVYNMKDASQPYGGLLSDQTFQVTYVRSMISGNWFSDYYDPRLPAHYPPLYFWISALFAQLFGLSSIQSTIIMVGILLFLLPSLFFAVAKCLRPAPSSSKNIAAALGVGCLFGLGGYSTSFILTRHADFGFLQWIGLKPFEVLSAFLTISWLLAMSCASEKENGYGLWLFGGVLGGAGVLLYYPFWALGNIAFVLMLVAAIHQKKTLVKIVAKYVLATSLSVLLSVPYWFPYLRKVVQNGTGPNDALKWFDLAQLDPSSFTFGLGYLGVVFALGVYGLIRFGRASLFARSLGTMILVVYFWIIINFFSFAFLKISLLSQHATILLFPLWSLFSGVTAYELIPITKERFLKGNISSEGMCLLILCAAFLTLPSAMSWNTTTDGALASAKQAIPEAVQKIAALIDTKRITILGGQDKQNPGVVYFLPAIAPVSLFLSPVPYYANPLSDYHGRARQVEAIFQQSDPTQLATGLSQLGIDGMLLAKISDTDWGVGIAEPQGYGYKWRWLTIPSTMVGNSAFSILYQDNAVTFVLIAGGWDTSVKGLVSTASNLNSLCQSWISA